MSEVTSYRVSDDCGHFDMLAARRDAILSTGRVSPAARARILGQPFYRPVAKTHTITVDLKAGTRIVENGPPGAKPPVLKARRKRVVRRLDPNDLPPTKHRAVIESPYSVQDVLTAVAASFDLPIYALTSKTRSQRVARPRFAAALLLREKRFMSFKRLGHALGRRDHTTMMHEVKRARVLRETDPKWAADYHAAEWILCGDP